MKRMLFNATHQEELRVAIVEGQKLIDLDIETAGREQRKGNIYKGVVTRVEPSLEACFVNYGEDRHGFLPFKEISRAYFKPGVDARTARVQDAIAEGQSLIVQVEKEERGNKGAALTTYISLAGRYLVLMPNNPRGGGVSRRVEGEERQELRETMEKLEVPAGMSLIARTAGIGRDVDALQWDLNYLLQLWSAIDGAAKDNTAPILIYLESSLVIRAIRDYFSPDIGEVLIDTPDIFEQAQAFMSVVMPDNLHRVKQYRDDVPLFSRFQIEHQIETAYGRNVPLPSGGAIVIDHTEALVAVDVNSARSTRGSDIEETAMRTNLEAADEVARQLRLRDLGGLIVIDFIDMDEGKNQRAVEMRLRDALHHDRARVQMGKISRFGLMELSRQRLRPALNEGSHITCPRCTGTGVIRDTESSALHVIRLIQEESMKENTAAIHAQVPVDVATYLLNEKRGDIAKLEARLKVNIVLIPNKHIETPHHLLTRMRHDDPRLETPRASFELVESKEDDSIYSRREDDSKSRPQAVVKGITPSQPAPQTVERATAAGANGRSATSVHVPSDNQAGLINRILGWFRRGDENSAPHGGRTTKPASPAVAPSSTSSAPVASSAERTRSRASNSNGTSTDARRSGGRSGSGRSRHQQTDERTESVAATSEALIDNSTDERAADGQVRSRGNRGGRGRGRSRSESNKLESSLAPALAVDDEDLPSAFFETTINEAEPAVTAGNNLSRTEQRPARRRRGAGINEPERSAERQSDGTTMLSDRNLGVQTPALATAVDGLTHDMQESDDEPLTDALTHPEGVDAEGEDRPSRRRRGRRGRRGGRRETNGSETMGAHELDAAEGESAPLAFIPNEVLLAKEAEARTHASPATESAQPALVQAEHTAHQPPYQNLVATADSQPNSASFDSSSEELDSSSAHALISEAVSKNVTNNDKFDQAPVANEIKTQPAAAFAKPVLDTAGLQLSVKEVGLEWVETDHDKWMQTQLTIASAPKPVRQEPVRIKAVSLVDSGPLEQVETRQS